MYSAHRDTVDTQQNVSAHEDDNERQDSDGGNVSLSVRSEGINSMPPTAGSQVVMGFQDNK